MSATNLDAPSARTASDFSFLWANVSLVSPLPAARSAVLLIVVVAALTLVGGGLAVVLHEQDLTAAAAQDSDPRPETPRLDTLVPTAQPVQEFGQGGPGITPTPPKMLAIAPAVVPKQTRFALAALKHVEKVAVVDAGSVKVSGTAINLLAVEPQDFRSWTPKPVADQPELWSALARGELVADSAAVKRLGLRLGAAYQIDGGPRLRVAASATLGLTGVDGIVSAETGRSLGLMPGVAVLLHGKAGTISAKGVKKLLGKGSQVVALGSESPKDPAPAKAVTRPGSYLELYKLSATRCPGLSWTVLAAIGHVESSHGRNNGPSSAGALGPMQFMPATWKAYGVDGDGDGKRDIWSPYDAVPGAANYLCANGAGKGGEKLRKAIWFYNHSWEYVNKVMGLADAYARGYA